MYAVRIKTMDKMKRTRPEGQRGRSLLAGNLRPLRPPFPPKAAARGSPEQRPSDAPRRLNRQRPCRKRIREKARIIPRKHSARRMRD